MSKSICKDCKHKSDCDETVRIYGLPNMRVTKCKEYEQKDCDTKMTLTREETIERLKQNKAAAEYYAGQSRITAEIENSLKDSEAFEMAIEALQDRPTGVWIDKGGYNECSECGEVAQKVELCDCVYERLTKFCPNCGAKMNKGGADMRSEKEYLDKTFPEHEGGEWLDITDMMTRESKDE